jgi:hypothetical protein
VRFREAVIGWDTGRSSVMSVDHGHGQAAVLEPHRIKSVVAGLVALVCLTTLSATFFGLLTWGVVRLARTFFA